MYNLERERERKKERKDKKGKKKNPTHTQKDQTRGYQRWERGGQQLGEFEERRQRVQTSCSKIHKY